MLTDRPAYASLDNDLRFRVVNDRLLAVLGKTREELIGRGYLEVYPQSAGSDMHRLILKAQASMTPQRRRTFSQPLQIWLEVEVFPLSDGVQVAFTPVDEP